MSTASSSEPMRPTLQMILPWVGPNDAFPGPSALLDHLGYDGLVAASAGITPAMLRRAYAHGVFPWSGPESAVFWWNPAPRMVLELTQFKCHRSTRQAARQFARAGGDLLLDHGFEAVIAACAQTRPGQDGTWITRSVRQAYGELHRQGQAHCVSLRDASGALLGGLYLVSLGGMVFGESMFSRVPNAGKVCLAALVAWLQQQGGTWIDCQQQTDHLASLGAQPISREAFDAGLVQRLSQAEFAWRPQVLDWQLVEALRRPSAAGLSEGATPPPAPRAPDA